jgi:hypothetical protein
MRDGADPILAITGISAASIIERCATTMSRRSAKQSSPLPDVSPTSPVQNSPIEALKLSEFPAMSALDAADIPEQEFITLLYGSLLNRNPNADELAFRIDQLQCGRSRIMMIARVAFSREARRNDRTKVKGVIMPAIVRASRLMTIFERPTTYNRVNRHRTKHLSLRKFSRFSDRAFVVEAYKTFLHRKPENLEIQRRLQELSNGRTRLSTLLRIAFSYESRRGPRPRTNGLILPSVVCLSRALK